MGRFRKDRSEANACSAAGMILVLALLLMATGVGWAWDWHYSPDFSDASGLTMVASAGCANDSCTYGRTWLRINPAVSGCSGAVWKTQKVRVADGFIAEYQVSFTNQGFGGADGLAFNVQNKSISDSSGEWGTSSNSLSVCLRTYMNAGDPSDSMLNLVGRDASGALVRSVAFNLHGIDVQLKDGRRHMVRVEYSAGLVTVKVDGKVALGAIELELTDCDAYDINGEAWVGFTARSGGVYENHDVCYWAFKSASPAYSNTSCRVHAAFYPWWAKGSYEGYWYHWSQMGHIPANEDIACNFWPQLGIYSVQDRSDLEQQMRWLRDAGVGVISVSYISEPEIMRAMPLILDCAEDYGIKVCINLEMYGYWDMPGFISQVKLLVDTYGAHPAIFRDPQRGGRPWLYIYSADRFATTDWAAAIDELRGTRYDAVFLAENLFDYQNDVVNGHFDGFYNYNLLSDTSGWAARVAWANSNGKIYVPQVLPGYDDTAVRSGVPVIDRNDGAFYDGQWSAALAAGAQYVGITSWNEWHEGTQIEPAIPMSTSGRTYQDYGLGGSTMYVDKTASWAMVLDPGNSGKTRFADYSGGASAQDGVDYHDTTTGNAGGQYRSQNADIYTSSEGGYAVGLTAAGEWLRFANINITVSGSYEVRVRTSNSSVQLKLCDGSLANVVATLNVPSTASVSTWVTNSTTFLLNAGSHTFYWLINQVTTDARLAWFEIRPALNGISVPEVAEVSIVPGSKSFISPFGIMFDCATPGADIRYTTDGSTPTLTSPAVIDRVPLNINDNSVVNAIAWSPGYSPRSVMEHESYTKVEESWDWQYGPIFNGGGLTLVESASIANDEYTYFDPWLRVCPSVQGTRGAAWKTGKVHISDGFVMECTVCMSQPVYGGADGMAISLQNHAQDSIGDETGPPASAISLALRTYPSVINSQSWAQLLVRMPDGTTFDAGVVDLDSSKGILLKDENPHNVRIVYGCKKISVWIDGKIVFADISVDPLASGACDAGGNAWVGFSARSGGSYENHDVSRWKFKAKSRVETPVITPSGGFYPLPSSLIGISCSTPAAVIHYTTNGSTPDETSPVYTSPIPMNNFTLKAIALRSDLLSSAQVVARYDIAEMEAETITGAKSLIDGAYVACSGIVTMSFADGAFWMEDENRNSGILVVGSTRMLTVGTIVDVYGTMSTHFGDRYINASSVYEAGQTTSPSPLGMTAKSLGGGSTYLQIGVENGSGPNNIGLLVRSWGALSYNCYGQSTFSDGAAEVTIQQGWRNSAVIDPDWAYISITGASRCDNSSGTAKRKIVARSVKEISGSPEPDWDFAYAPDFTDASGISVYGDAGLVISNKLDDVTRLRLTSNQTGSYGSAYLAGKLTVASGFVTKFAFQISEPLNEHGNAISFLMQNVGPTSPAYDTPGSVAVSVNTYQKMVLEVHENGFATRKAQVDLGALGINVKDDGAHLMEVICQPALGLVSVKIDGVPVISDLSVDFSTAIDGDGMSWVGFGGICGGAAENHDIIYWKLRSLTTQ